MIVHAQPMYARHLEALEDSLNHRLKAHVIHPLLPLTIAQALHRLILAHQA
ncbi:hypothetical protein D3C75_1257420 [compost metagenome]